MENKKLLYVINHMDWFWSHRLPLAQGAQKDGWNVIVAADKAQSDQKLKDHEFSGRALPSFASGMSILSAVKTVWTVHQLIKRENPDIIHAITLKYAFMAGLAARLHKDTKVVHTIAGLGYLFSGEGFKPKLLRTIVGPFLKIALKHPRAQIIFQNPDDQNLLLSRNFVRPAQCHLIKGSGVDTQQFDHTAEPENNPPVILMPTRLLHDKGIAVFIETARILKQQGTKARFQIAGGESQSNPLAITKSEMNEMIADGCVEWLGKVDDMPALLKSCNLIVYPSYYREGVPKVLLESAASGRAIITTDHPGCREAVEDQRTGLLVAVKDPEATANAIQVLLDDPKKRRKMGAAAREKTLNEFDVKIIVQRTLSVYNTALVS